MELAGSVALWIIAFAVVSVVIFQAIIFIRIARKTAPEIGMTNQEIRSAVRVSFITSLGRSIAIGIVVVSLITILGSPMSLARLGIIGAAPTELGAAEVGARVAGIPLGSEFFTSEAFAIVVWTMSAGGMGWLIFVLFFTKTMG